MVPKIAIVGLDQVGKTTFFKLLTGTRRSAASGKPGAHLGVIQAPDARLERLAGLAHSKKIVHACVECVDTPGSIIQLARAGIETASLRETDALAHVVRAFGTEAGLVGGSTNLQREVENVELELILSDLAAVEKRVEKLAKDIKKQKSADLEKEYQVLEACKSVLEKQTPLREKPLSVDEERAIRGFGFLSLKPMLYVLNLGENDAARTREAEQLARDLGFKARPKTGVTAVSGKIEAEMAELEEAEAREYLTSYGLEGPGVTRFLRAMHALLGLIAFFTANESECRAWTVRCGTTAFEAAGEVHTDFQRGFIRAEVVEFEKLLSAGSFVEARNQGIVKLEGKESVLRDGDVVYFRHS